MLARFLRPRRLRLIQQSHIVIVEQSTDGIAEENTRLEFEE
jgi:hypothetical protein